MKKVILFTLFSVLGLYSYAQSTNYTRFMSLRPNPTNGQVQILMRAMNENTIAIRIFDSRGKLLEEHQAPIERGDNVIDIDITNHPSGCYHITMIDKQEMVASGRLIKY